MLISRDSHKWKEEQHPLTISCLSTQTASKQSGTNIMVEKKKGNEIQTFIMIILSYRRRLSLSSDILKAVIGGHSREGIQKRPSNSTFPTLKKLQRQMPSKTQPKMTKKTIPATETNSSNSDRSHPCKKQRNKEFRRGAARDLS